MCKEAATNLFRIPVIYEEKDLRKEAAANLFSIPVIYIEKICMAWVQMRKYETCVVCMSILLRICLAGAPTPCKLFE